MGPLTVERALSPQDLTNELVIKRLFLFFSSFIYRIRRMSNLLKAVALRERQTATAADRSRGDYASTFRI